MPNTTNQNPDGVLVKGRSERDRLHMSKVIMSEDIKAKYVGNYSYFFPQNKDGHNALVDMLEVLFNQYGLMLDYLTGQKLEESL